MSMILGVSLHDLGVCASMLFLGVCETGAVCMLSSEGNHAAATVGVAVSFLR